jgi:hypothetical protein
MIKCDLCRLRHETYDNVCDECEDYNKFQIELSTEPGALNTTHSNTCNDRRRRKGELKMRELNIGTKKHTKVVCLDEKGAGNACHQYEVQRANPESATEENWQTVLTNVRFQNGPIQENGVNGCHDEDLIAIVIDRLEGFQSGDYRCRENAVAIIKLEGALLWLRKRTMDREARGVEGTSVK